MSATDVESLQPASRQRSRCLDAFLLGSVIILLCTVVSGGALGFWIVRDLSMKVDRFTTVPEAFPNLMKQTQEGPSSDASYKVQNFAYFIPKNSQLKNSSMQWEPITYGNTTTIGSRYSYDSNHEALKTDQAGSYFLFTQLNLTCTGICSNGSLHITFEDNSGVERLSCTLNLPNTPSSPLVEKCWSMIPHLPGGTRLMARMQANVPPKAWKLDLNNSGFGMLLVDRP